MLAGPAFCFQPSSHRSGSGPFTAECATALTVIQQGARRAGSERLARVDTGLARG
jgi:hypothetical protein